MISSAICAALLATAPASQRLIDGVLIASNDSALAEKLQKQFRLGTAFDGLSKEFPSPRFSVHEWGQRSAIVVDEQLPLLAEKRGEVVVLGLLARHLSNDKLTVNLKDLTSEERKDITAFLAPYYPLAGDATPSFGLRTDTQFSMQGKGKSSAIGFRVPQNSDLDRSSKGQLRSSPYTIDPPRYASESEKARRDAEVTKKAMANRRTLFTYFGFAERNAPEGYVKFGEILDASLKDLAKKRQAASEEIGKKLGAGRRDLPLSSSFGELPQDVKEQLKQQALGSWQANGFNSAEEAEAFLTNANVRISTSVFLQFCVDPGGPGRPAAFGAIQIGAYPGSVPP